MEDNETCNGRGGLNGERYQLRKGVLTQEKESGAVYQLSTAVQQTTPKLGDFKHPLTISHQWLGQLESSSDVGWSPLIKADFNLCLCSARETG